MSNGDSRKELVNPDEQSSNLGISENEFTDTSVIADGFPDGFPDELVYNWANENIQRLLQNQLLQPLNVTQRP